MYKLLIPFNKNSQTHEMSVDEPMLLRLAIHGARQKGNDSYVQTDKNKVAKFPTDTAKWTRFVETLTAIELGEWSTRADGLSPVDRKAWTMLEASLAKKGLKGKALDVEAERIMAIPANLAAMQKRAEAAIAAESELMSDLPDAAVEGEPEAAVEPEATVEPVTETPVT